MLYRKQHRLAVKSDVNLTPLIDVMTSLLAIFMITAPLLTTGIPLDLPKGDGKTLPGEEKTLDLSINSNGDIFIGTQQISKSDILAKLKAIVGENPSIRLVISADRTTPYGMVIELMAMLRKAGYVQVGLKTDFQTVSLPTTSQKKGK